MLLQKNPDPAKITVFGTYLVGFEDAVENLAKVTFYKDAAKNSIYWHGWCLTMVEPSIYRTCQSLKMPFMLLQLIKQATKV